MKWLLSLFCLLLLSACDNQKAFVSSSAPDQSAVITMHAEKQFRMEPWKVDIRIKNVSLNQGEPFSFENETFSNEFISFHWKDNTHCHIQLQEQDGNVIEIDLDVKKKQINFVNAPSQP
jgi:hypothetical protein